MSHLQYYAYKGVGEAQLKNFAYNQAVRVGDTIQISGQGGWDRETFKVDADVNKQIDQAFDNVDHTLKDAGGKGWSQVFRVNSYHVPITNESQDAMVRNFRKWMPDHKPIWTVLSVPRLGEESMTVEIEVVAHDPEGAAKAAASK